MAAMYQEQVAQFPIKRMNNTLPIFGNKETMNINSMILTNIHQSRYFKSELIELKTFHEVIDEIFYKVTHLEPWERNSRKLTGQVGMCAGVRGVAAGGIVSTPFCILFKLFTLRLTRKQLTVMLNHSDSPYIRGLGFMYIRYCQPPNDLLHWFSGYLEDEEEIDLKAGGGFKTTIGSMCRMMLSKMEWFGTMFPRMPVTVQKELKEKLTQVNIAEREREEAKEMASPPKEETMNEKERLSPDRPRRRDRSRSPDRRRRSRSPRRRSRDRDGSRSPRNSRRSSRERRRSHSRERNGHRHHRSRSRDRKSDNRHSRRNRSRSRSPHRRHKEYR